MSGSTVHEVQPLFPLLSGKDLTTTQLFKPITKADHITFSQIFRPKETASLALLEGQLDAENIRLSLEKELLASWNESRNELNQQQYQQQYHGGETREQYYPQNSEQQYYFQNGAPSSNGYSYANQNSF